MGIQLFPFVVDVGCTGTGIQSLVDPYATRAMNWKSHLSIGLNQLSILP